MSQISFAAWIQITGPTFVTMVLGFSLLWNAQQASNASLLEIQRSVGRLEGSLNALDARIEGLDGRLRALDATLAQLGDAVSTLAP